MSTFSTIYDNLVTKCQETIGDEYKRLPNPYAPADNNGLFLKRAWGILIGPGNISEIDVSCRKSGYTRILSIVLARQMSALPHATEKRADIEIDLVDDFQSLRNALEQDVTLSNSCVKIEYSADSGIEFFNPRENQRYISVSLDLVVIYEERLS